MNDTRALGLDPQHLGKANTWGCVMEALSDWDGSGRWSPLGGGHRALGDALKALEVLHELAEPPQWCLPKKLRRPAPVPVGA